MTTLPFENKVGNDLGSMLRKGIMLLLRLAALNLSNEYSSCALSLGAERRLPMSIAKTPIVGIRFIRDVFCWGDVVM